MDNRLKFLYCDISELWGHSGKHEPEKENPVQAPEEYGRQIRHAIQKCDAERTKVAKHAYRLSRKAAIAYITPVP